MSGREQCRDDRGHCKVECHHQAKGSDARERDNKRWGI